MIDNALRWAKRIGVVFAGIAVLLAGSPYFKVTPTNGTIGNAQKLFRELTGKNSNSFDSSRMEKVNAERKKATKAISYEKASLVRVKDGDTYVVKKDGTDVTVRLIGVDTPESVHNTESKNTVWGKRISKIVKKKLTAGKTVWLQYDSGKTDIYGRDLAYVYVKNGDKKSMINKWLVKKGYARAVYYSPNGKYRDVFEKLQVKAKKMGLGFWERCSS